MDKLARYLTAQGAAEALTSLGPTLGTDEFVVVRNIDYVHSPFEIYPLAPKVRPPLPRIAAFAVDMDGTSTTTEPLALHSLEYMVRRFTGHLTPDQWPGLDKQLDYPYVIGNSNFRHAEFLLGRYRQMLDMTAFRDAFFEAVVWTLASMTDAHRRKEIRLHARNCGLGEMLADAEFQRLTTAGAIAPDAVAEACRPLIERFGAAFRSANPGETVAAVLDIYYMRYHSIMQAIEQGEGESLSHELLGESGRLLIEPMPGYDVFIPLVKGWIGEADAGALYDMLHARLKGHGDAPQADIGRGGLQELARHFSGQPAKAALVTASIAFETHATMREVCRVMSMRVADWSISQAGKDRVLAGLADYRNPFDAFICATDACEHRLKPHRDLYSLALAQMAMPKTDYALCVGLEDTEPGIISLRAAGIGCAVGLPNHDTSRQDFRAAALVVPGGLPELILHHACFLQIPGANA